MNRALTGTAVLTVALMLGGCGDSDDAAAERSSSASERAEEQARDAVGALERAAAGAGDAAERGAQRAGELREQADELRNQAGEIAADRIAEAETLLSQVAAHLNENRIGEADSVLTRLEAIHPQLPEVLQTRIVELRGLVDQAKAAGMQLQDAGQRARQALGGDDNK